jgi:predicted MPP superfamily phosphohydrolase
MFEKAGNPETIRLVALPDIHVDDRDDRGHDERAMACVMDFLSWYSPDALLIGGDFLDMGPISHWGAEDMNSRRLVPQIQKGREILSGLVNLVPRAKENGNLFFVEGNHEDWLRQWLVLGTNPIVFDGIEELGIEFNVPGLLNLKGYGFTFFPLNEFVRIGKANFTHGLFCGDAHAKKHLMELKCNIFYFHLHDTQSYIARSIDGPLEAQSLGCLCRKDAPFLKGKPNNWRQAFGVFEFFPDGSFTKTVPEILDGKMSYAGRVFKY